LSTANSNSAFDQLREGIKAYQSVVRKHIPLALPFYPLGMPNAKSSVTLCLALVVNRDTDVPAWAKVSVSRHPKINHFQSDMQDR
jgi:hypothetical protein